MKNKNQSYYLHSICNLIFLVILIFCCSCGNKTVDDTEDDQVEELSEEKKADLDKQIENAIKTRASVGTIQDLITKRRGSNHSVTELSMYLFFCFPWA